MTQRTLAATHACNVLASRFATAPPAALASYAALPDELNLDALHAQWWAKGRCVWLPRVVGPGLLAWHPVTSADHLVRGAYGIREPSPAAPAAAPLPLTATMLVPGVGFTAAGERLGQGGGFYDRLLATHRGPTIGIAFACQRLASLPCAAHDRSVSEVLFAD